MTSPLMPKATAVWLIDNTALTFQQIADFCGLHVLEVETMANAEKPTLIGLDPLANGQLNKEEIERCEKDENADLVLQTEITALKQKTSKYTPIARRQDKPNAIAWLLKNYPNISDRKVVKLIGTTKNTIEAIRTKTHWNMQNIKPHSPVLLGICTESELNKTVAGETEVSS